jgi:hypothetical protein
MRARFFLPPFLAVLIVSSLLLLAGVLGRLTGLTSSAPADKKQKENATKVGLSYLTRPTTTTATTAIAAMRGKKKTMPPVDLSYLQKTWGLECKSQNLDNVIMGGDGWRITFRLEFTRDVPNPKEMLREQATAREP